MSMDSNLLLSNLDENMRDVFAITFEFYKIAETKKESYQLVSDRYLTKKLIWLYYTEIKPNYDKMFYNFKKKYIENEAKVEKNDTELEQAGIGLMYDYIQNFDPKTSYFNIFVTGLELHRLLFAPLDENAKKQRNIEYEELLKLQAEAKEQKDLKKYKEAKERLKNFSDAKDIFGGQLRDREVTLKDSDVKVPNSIEAKAFYNSFLNQEKVMEYKTFLDEANIFNYIDYCVHTVANLIKYQPFNDGNKRTFRGLLNLLFKNKNIPPVYITVEEREAYKDALFKAMQEDDYTDLYNFYYFKICDSIYELDIKPYLEEKERKEREKRGLQTLSQK